MRIGRILLVWTCFYLPSGFLQAQAPASTRVGPTVAGKPIVRVGIIADAQFCDCDANLGRFYRISLEKLHAAVDTFNAQGVDMVVNVGDLIDQDLKSYPVVLKEIERLKMPVHHLLGNHEFWNVPFHMQKTIYDSLGLSAGYCDMEFPGWRFLMLDGTELAEYAQGAHPEMVEEGELCRSSLAGHANKEIWNGAISESQTKWIEWQLAEAAEADQKVALFCHFPISPAGHPMTLWNEADMRVLLAKFPQAEAWFAGHSHGGGYHLLQGLHHLTFGGMLMTPDSNAFAILNFFSDQIVVEGFGREAYRVLPMAGSQAVADTILPDTLTPPDAMPEPVFPCVHRRVFDEFGRVVWDGEYTQNEPWSPRKLKPGCYEVAEQTEGRWTFSRLSIPPKARD
ncbi:MAG: metallophosphoesterase [Bacteroidetes bacterium]|nr:metallophosphoesterase [Bacteroidota bacterium]